MESSSTEQVLHYRQRLEKSTGGEVKLMEWSPTMDLLAVAMADHSVVLNRLSWQRVWTMPSATTLVTAITWRPDGRVLAVGHTDGTVGLHDVENGKLLNSFKTSSPITNLRWTKLDQESDVSSYKEEQSPYLPPLPLVESRDVECSADPKKLQPTETLRSLHVLIVGDEVGRVHLYMLGIFLIATLVNSDSGGQVILSRMSRDFKQVTHVMMSSSPLAINVCSRTLGRVLLLRSNELQHMAMKFGYVSYQLEYMASTLKAMYEGWDDLLFNLDSQLAGYSQTLPEGRTVGEEFLVLLACGKASQKLQDFLISELTAKGVKKLGLSLEHSYDSIRKLLLHHFQSGLQGLQLHLGEVLGMARCLDQFRGLGLVEGEVQECVNSVGTLALKSREMLQAIDHSLQSIKVFFLWLYVMILKLSNESIPKGLKEDLSPEELQLIIDFLEKRFTKARAGEHAFNLETVGQYLKSEDLKYIEERPADTWEQLMQTLELPGPAVPWLYLPKPSKSLVQLFESLHTTVQEAFSTPAEHIYKLFASQHSENMCTELPGVSSGCVCALACHFTHSESGYLCLPASVSSNKRASSSSSSSSSDRAPHACNTMLLLRYPTTHQEGESLQTKKLTFFVRDVEGLAEREDNRNYDILSVQYYNEDHLSILFQYSFDVPRDPTPADSATSVTMTHSFVAQLPTGGVVSLLPPSSHDTSVGVDVGPMLTQVHHLGVFKAGHLAVSGNRKVAAVVSANGKKIRVFDVDAEEEDDDD